MSKALKEEFVALLKERRIDRIAGLVAEKRGNLRYLSRLLYHQEDLVRWRAIEAMGEVADRLADDDPEGVRIILRNLLWSINEESGGIGWSAPHCIGEIVHRRPDMFGEFASIVLYFTDEEMLKRGVLWAAARIAQSRPELVSEEVPRLTGFLEDPDPVVRGYTLRFLAFMGERLDFDHYSGLLNDTGEVPVYENGELKVTTVADLAARLAKK
ncbi:MAG: DVU0298 family protein [Bacillota bacterium]